MNTFWHRFGVWSAICVVSAAPSFVLGAMLHNDPFLIAAMLLGILTFILGYTLITGTSIYGKIRRGRFVRSTLYVGYGTRIFCSVIYPIGATMDMICGMGAIGLTESILGSSMAGDLSGGGTFPGTFIGVYLTTVIQGTILNILLVAFMVAVYALSWLILGWKKPPTEGQCRRCRYDIRASTGQCPECGHPIGDFIVPDPMAAAPPTEPMRPALEPERETVTSG